ncbi:hypothetical protein ACIA5D_50355 [Actinoplanes sp. NPDC051513]|uniref:hypothetical protein n=1 Tax=Actinoplanes sp. NPDC051513 TaxID=3363908 RepID=UPI0037A93336
MQIGSEGAGLTDVPRVDLLALHTRLLFADPIDARQRAVDDQVRQSVGARLLQCVLQLGCLFCQDIDDFVPVPVGGRLRQPDAQAELANIAAVAQPHQPENCLPPGGEAPGVFARASLAPLGAQQLGKVRNRLAG